MHLLPRVYAIGSVKKISFTPAVSSSLKTSVISVKKQQKKKISGDTSTGGAGATGGGTEADERLYCTCQQVSYGEMIACDGKVILIFLF